MSERDTDELDDDESGTHDRLWPYAEAARAVPYIRILLEKVREHFIAAWHFFRLNGYDPDGQAHYSELDFHRVEGAAIEKELHDMFIMQYQNPLRGIALFPFFATVEGKPKEAFWVFKDSRDEIETFVIYDDLVFYHDLYGWEKPVPEVWKRAGTIPTLNEEAKP